MTCEIICVGTELLLGDILNTDAQYLSVKLAEVGINVFYQSVVGDNSRRLEEVLKTALSRSDLVITTGGLGPTEDDITKEVCAKVAGVPLFLDAQCLKDIETYFKSKGKIMAEINKKQALMPEKATVLKNNCGTAPGCIMEVNGKRMILLPGPISELRKMMEESVLPYLESLSGGAIVSHSIHLFGMGEAQASEIAAELLEGKNPSASPYAKDGEILFRITASAETREKAEDMCRPVIVEFFNLFGSFIYGMDCGSLESRVVTLLKKKELKVALAESCTGGMLSGRVTDVSGSSNVFECGVVSYSNEIKTKLLSVNPETLSKCGAVSPQVAVQMAEGIRKVGNSELGIGITGISGPGGGTPDKPVGLIYVALCDSANVWVKEITTGEASEGCRHYNRRVATSTALNMLRLYLEERLDFAEEELDIRKGAEFGER